LRVRPSKLKGPDILGLWLALLAWSAIGPPQQRQALLLAEDAAFALHTDLTPEEAGAILGNYLAWYWEGLHRPLPVLPKGSYVFALRTLADKEPEGAVLSAWEGNQHQGIPGDRDDPYIRFVLGGGGGDPFYFAGFARLAMDLYGQVLTLQTDGRD
jgi:exodeoxyribonuclease V gamma subunit